MLILFIFFIFDRTISLFCCFIMFQRNQCWALQIVRLLRTYALQIKGNYTFNLFLCYFSIIFYLNLFNRFNQLKIHFVTINYTFFICLYFASGLSQKVNKSILKLLYFILIRHRLVIKHFNRFIGYQYKNAKC